MKKYILIVVITIFVLGSASLILGIINKMKKHNHLTEKIARLPSFTFMTLAKDTFNSSCITKGPVLVIRFHPECEHCQYEISEILKSNIPSSGTKVIMVSSAEPYEIRRFFNQFDLSDYTSIIPLVDTSYIFGDIFGSDIIPSNYIYNEELNLVKVVYGEVKTEALLKYLHGSEQDK